MMNRSVRSRRNGARQGYGDSPLVIQLDHRTKHFHMYDTGGFYRHKKKNSMDFKKKRKISMKTNNFFLVIIIIIIK